MHLDRLEDLLWFSKSQLLKSWVHEISSFFFTYLEPYRTCIGLSGQIESGSNPDPEQTYAETVSLFMLLFLIIHYLHTCGVRLPIVEVHEMKYSD